MELRHLHYFVTVAETLHFGRAAERLHISQPPLSRQIALLEEEVGVVLFERNRRSVKLSAAGERFLLDAKDILGSVERAKQNALTASQGASGSLSVGFMFAAAYSVVPPITLAYASRFPAVDLHLTESIPRLLMQDMRQSSTDVALMYPPEDHPELETRTVFREPIVAALPADHRLARGSGPIDVVELKGESFLISPRAAAPYIYDIIIGHCKQRGFTPKIRLETNYQQTIVTLVGQGLGVALVHRSMKTARPRNVKFRPLQNPPYVELNVTWDRLNRNPCIGTFVTVAQEVGAVATPGA
ncbi:LysR substrate-binding domain-containing protein [Paraburkholderia sp. HD33-4]|uniref:LysR substrate-binding domain-containing protein n=1 Tax=Paraburkholderia sp. HD33-4 TaxID=2883242 RepID=UPI001F3BC051|nr:LysR substrate-binding domain-containing protein [Paraburkholderia sp. HD33-4]